MVFKINTQITFCSNKKFFESIDPEIKSPHLKFKELFENVPINLLLTENSLNLGMRIDIVESKSIKLFLRQKFRQDMLQISLQKHAIIWDLKNHEEVSSIDDYQDFTTV